MTRAQALARLELYLLPESEPTLTPTQVGALLDAHALADVDGLPPNDPAWLGAWDVKAAARQGWLIKAAKVAGLVNLTSDGQQTSYSDLHDHCLSQAARYNVVGSVSVGIGAV